MSAGHSHSHTHSHATAASGHRRRLLLVLGITGTIFVAQVIGGLASGSLALLADAGHMLTDATGIVIALVAATLALRPPTTRRTFGLQRGEILAASANAMLLTGVGIWVMVEAARRWNDPADVQPAIMLAVAVVGGMANAVSLLILQGSQSESLNMRGAYLEVLGDLLGSVAVVIAGLVIVFTGWVRADSLASVAIALMILPRAWALLREVIDVLLESTPRGVDLDVVRSHIAEAPWVVDVHDLHAWTITSGVPVLSAHVVVDRECIDDGRVGEVLDHLSECLGDHFDVEHCTFQIEPVGHQAHEPLHHA